MAVAMGWKALAAEILRDHLGQDQSERTQLPYSDESKAEAAKFSRACSLKTEYFGFASNARARQ